MRAAAWASLKPDEERSLVCDGGGILASLVDELIEKALVLLGAVASLDLEIEVNVARIEIWERQMVPLSWMGLICAWTACRWRMNNINIE